MSDTEMQYVSELDMHFGDSYTPRELAAALTAAYIQGPSRDKVGNSCTDCALWTCSVRGALGQLLAWSHDAKMAAMDANLLQATVGALQSLHGAHSHLLYALVSHLQLTNLLKCLPTCRDCTAEASCT